MIQPQHPRTGPRRVLLVEDHPELSLWVGKALRAQGLEPAFALDGGQADAMLTEQRWDLVLLDLTLPGLDGLQVLRRLRERGDAVPVLVLTARGELGDRVRGLNMGADDYLTKPFELAELEARVAALLRRPPALAPKRTRVGSLVFDHEQGAFYLAQAPLSLTRREQAVLSTLMLREGRGVSKEFLHEAVFGDDDATLDAVEVVVFRVRRKLEGSDVRIQTLRGLGYLLEQVV